MTDSDKRGQTRTNSGNADWVTESTTIKIPVRFEVKERELLTKREVAELLSLDVRTIEQMMHDGMLPYIKYGWRNKKAKIDRRPVRFRREDVFGSGERFNEAQGSKSKQA